MKWRAQGARRDTRHPLTKAARHSPSSRTDLDTLTWLHHFEALRIAGEKLGPRRGAGRKNEAQPRLRGFAIQIRCLDYTHGSVTVVHIDHDFAPAIHMLLENMDRQCIEEFVCHNDGPCIWRDGDLLV